MSCIYWGVWGTATRDMSDTKERLFRKTEEARDLLRHHPLSPSEYIDLFTSIGVGAFRYSAALVFAIKRIGHIAAAFGRPSE